MGSGLNAKNLAKAFTPRTPMYATGTDPKVFRVKGDIPKPLQEALQDNLEPIGPDCLKQNAEACLEVYGDICLKHVLSMQVQNKTLQKLMCMDPSLHHKDKYKGTGLINACVAKSSMIGRDPCGDQPVPKPKKKKKKTADTGEEAGEAADTEDEDNEYSQEQILLIEIQNKNYEYLTAHVGLILEDSIYNKITAKEMQYKADEGKVHTKSARNRMPWFVYLSTILEDLTDEHELYVLTQLIGLRREEGNSVKRWVQRIEIGKRLVVSIKITLPDKVYVLKMLQGLDEKDVELNLLCKGLQQRALKASGNDKKILSAPQARKQLREMKWAEMLPLVEESIDEQTAAKFKQSFNLASANSGLFTLKQA